MQPMVSGSNVMPFKVYQIHVTLSLDVRYNFQVLVLLARWLSARPEVWVKLDSE